jgi:hypothetical protein
MEYTPLANIILGFFICLYAFAIAVKAGSLYYKTKDKRMAIVSAVFLQAGFLKFCILQVLTI